MRTERQSIGCVCPKHIEALGKIAAQEEEILRLKSRVAHLEARLKIEIRHAKEAPFDENTPSSKQNFKKDSPEEKRARQGGAKPGHKGHGRKEVALDDADEAKIAEAIATCPDCGVALVSVAPRARILRDVPLPKFSNVHWTVERGMCPCCHRTFEGVVIGAMPRFAATNRALAVNADDHYRHHMPIGVVSRRMGFNKSTVLDEMRALAGILKPCVYRLWRWLRESNVRHADETKWPCNGAHSQYAWGFFARFVALFLFWRTRGATVPRVVLAGVKDGVTVHDGYTAYDKPCKEASQQCYAHIKRRFERLLKKEPENKEYQSFVPRMCDLLSESMKLRTKGLSPEDFAREAKRIRQKIEKMIDSCTKDPALQNIQIWMRERQGELFRWTESPNIPAENNHAERGVRGLVVARKISFGGQSEDALWVRGVMQSVMESLALLYDNPAVALAEALDIYANTGSKAQVRDFLFPKVMPRMRPGKPLAGQNPKRFNVA